MNQLSEEKQFWDRLTGMPWIEAEQECVLRREKLNLELAMLGNECARAKRERRLHEAHEIGVEMQAITKTITVVSDRIKYFRRRLDDAGWRRAVTALYGQEGFEACRIWMVAHEARAASEAKP